MESVAIIGGGISGLSAAGFLRGKFHTAVFEKEDSPGGLIRCRNVNGSLFHICGGHVFNSKSADALEWFWSKFREEDFLKASRNSSIILEDEEYVPYPIENHVYMLDKKLQMSFAADLKRIESGYGNDASFDAYSDFADFLRNRFGDTLYHLYFRPYNTKIWRQDLSQIPLSWMDGKLPMPTVDEMRKVNELKMEETKFVHSSFWYEKKGGSQYLANKLANDIDIRYGVDVKRIDYYDKKWIIGGETFDYIIFCGNIKEMVGMVDGVDLNFWKPSIEKFRYHGTTAVFCEIDSNPYSWIYLPSSKYSCHRIICTGNFSDSNNSKSIPTGRITATVEFTDNVSQDFIIDELKSVPLNPKYITHVYNEYTYPVQNQDTRSIISTLKGFLGGKGFYFTGRFADWEYYNMDMAVLASMKTCKNLLEKKEK